MLNELNVHAAEVADTDIPKMLEVLFELGDLLRPTSKGPAFRDDDDHRWHLHWLVNRLVRERFPIDRRAAILQKASTAAALGWLVDLADRCRREHEQHEDAEPDAPNDHLTTPDVAASIVALALERIRAAAESDELAAHPELLSILVIWKASSSNEARQWVSDRLGDDRFVLRLIEAATTVGWSQELGFGGLGDRVARRMPVAQRGALTALADICILLARVAEIERSDTLAAEDRAIIEQFRQGWQNWCGALSEKEPSMDEEAGTHERNAPS